MRYISLLLAFVVSLSIIPSATAQSAPGVIDFDPRDPLTPILAEEEVAKMAQLQATSNVFMLSPVSADEQIVLALLGNLLTFMDTQDGATIPISDEFFGLQLLNGLRGPYHWSDPNTLTTLAVIPPEKDSAAPRLQRVDLDRVDGAVRTQSLDVPLSGRMIDVAPDLSDTCAY